LREPGRYWIPYRLEPLKGDFRAKERVSAPGALFLEHPACAHGYASQYGTILYISYQRISQGSVPTMLLMVIFGLAGLATFVGLSVSFVAALPREVLESAERHGRFQGLQSRESLTQGTQASDPPTCAGLLAGG
jgi:hypothetical protein